MTFVQADGIGASKSALEAGLRTVHPAGSYAVLFDAEGELVSLQAGYADIEKKRPFDSSTRITIGELSQVIIAAMVMRSAKLALLELDESIGTYGTALPTIGDHPAARRLRECSLREALGHRTGIRANYALMYRGYDPERNLDSFFKDAPVPYPRAVNYLPSTCVYDILGLLVSARHGKGCDDVAEELIFAPFGMKSASYGKKAGDRLYAGHYKYGLPMTEYDEARYPSLSFVADGRDLVRFFGSFLLEGAAESAYCPPWLLDPPELTGLGRIAWYAGKYYGHRSCVILAPELGIGALAITNSWAWDAKTLLYELCSSLLTSYAAGESGPQKRPMRFE